MARTRKTIISKGTQTRDLLCELTDDEVRERGQKIAALELSQARSDDEEKSRRKLWKTRYEDVQSEIRELSHEVDSRRQLREVHCVIEWHMDSKREVIVRPDTGEIVESNPLTAKQLQSEMFPEAIDGGAAEEA